MPHLWVTAVQCCAHYFWALIQKSAVSNLIHNSQTVGISRDGEARGARKTSTASSIKAEAITQCQWWSGRRGAVELQQWPNIMALCGWLDNLGHTASVSE